MAGGRALTTPPEAGTYAFVLRRYDRSSAIPMRVQNYTEVAQSRDIASGGERAPTLFVRTRALRDRMVKLGWLDETRAWLKREVEVDAPPREDGLVGLTRSTLRSLAKKADVVTYGTKEELIERLRRAGAETG